MNIYTYFVPVSQIDYEGECRILNIWKRTWSEFGWNPVVLTENDAKGSPRYDWYFAQMKKKPFMNSFEYEMACFQRWLAMAQIGGGVHSDYDCMNNGLQPEDIKSFVEDGNMTVYEPAHIPSLVSGSYREYHRMVDLFAGFDTSHFKPEMHKDTRGGTSVSDMLIIANNPETVRPSKVVWEFRREAGWEKAKAIHFSHWACEGIGKEKALADWSSK